MNILENKEIKLRALEASDIDILYEWENNCNIWEVSNTLVPFSRYLLKKYLDSSHLDIYETKQLRMVIVNKENDEPIGLIDLFDFDPFHSRAGLGVLINSDKDRGKGYASQALECFINYAFQLLKLHQVYCNIPANNQSSINLFEKFGFTQCGIRKSWLRTLTDWQDEYSFQLINDNKE